MSREGPRAWEGSGSAPPPCEGFVVFLPDKSIEEHELGGQAATKQEIDKGRRSFSSGVQAAA